MDKIKVEAQEKGDLGLVAESSRSNQRMMFQPASLTAGGVFKKLKEIASMSGNSVSHSITFSLDELGKMMLSLYLPLNIEPERENKSRVIVAVHLKINY